MKESSDGSISAVYQLPFSAIPLSPHQATVIEKNFFMSTIPRRAEL
ncbi:MAG: hypothetical protein MK214_07450 [Thalassotalea sp.]|nr:hypothetical protein [Thalassotalea sp.]